MVDWIIFFSGILAALIAGLKLHGTWLKIYDGDKIYAKVLFLFGFQIIISGILILIILKGYASALELVEDINPTFYDSSSPILIAIGVMFSIVGLSATISSYLSRIVFEKLWKRVKSSDVLVVFKVVEYLLQWSLVVVIMSLIVSIGLLNDYEIGSVGDINRLVVGVASKESFDEIVVNGSFLVALISNSLLKIYYQLMAKIESERNLFDAYELIKKLSPSKDGSYFDNICAVVELTDSMNYKRILKGILIREQAIMAVASDVAEGDHVDEMESSLDDGGGVKVSSRNGGSCAIAQADLSDDTSELISKDNLANRHIFLRSRMYLMYIFLFLFGYLLLVIKKN